MGVQIRTIVKDNVASRCDGCHEVIDGTPWRVNLLDIVAAESPVAWTDRPAINPGPFQFHGDPACVRRWMADKGYLFCRRGEVREIMRPVAIPTRSAPLGPVRRHPPRRPRVRPGLTAPGAPRPVRRRGLTWHRRGAYPPPADRIGDTQIYQDFGVSILVSTGLGVRIPPRTPGPSAPSLIEASRAGRPSPSPRWLSLGPASRLLGVDPDTLRRWADDGRVEAYMTPGGHRRFDRRSIEQLVATRRAGHPTAGQPRRQPGAPDPGLPALVRHRTTATGGIPADDTVERERYRQDGRRLVEALVAHLDADAG